MSRTSGVLEALGAARRAPGALLPLAGAPAPEVALHWLVRLRWMAVLGQACTVGFVTIVIGVDLPTPTLLGIMGFTALTNLLLTIWLQSEAPLATRYAALMAPGLLTVDTLTLTALLIFAGGPENPFSLIYVVHVAMAAVALGMRWTWFFVFLIAACSASLFGIDYVPLQTLDGAALPPRLLHWGNWIAIALVSLVTAYFIARVVDAVRRREEQLSKLRSLAAKNERLASLTTLAAGAAHELGTPLATVAVVAKELERNSENDDNREDARLIRSQVDRCREILDRMVADADQAATQPELLEPELLFAELRRELGLRQDSQLEIESAGVERFVGPRSELLQALVPLVRNGIDASEGVSDEPIRVSLELSGGWVRLTVTDQGHGMPPEVLARAGEPFYTTKAPGRGMGLGLYLVRLLAERLSGQLKFESTPGAGTIACFEFPEPEAPSTSASLELVTTGAGVSNGASHG